MRICSVTLAGPGSEAIIGDALASASWVDEHVILGTGIDPHALPAPAIPFTVVPDVAWVDDFAAMRNLALDRAHAATGADWALILDTDERVTCPDPARLRQILADYSTDADFRPIVHVVSCMHVNGEYAKDRLFRLPRRGRYVGLTHEFYLQDEETPVLRLPPDLLAFDELPRNPATREAALRRDERLLKREHLRDAHNPRWPFYLGQTYDHLGQPDDALRWWKKAARSGGEGWDEVRAWSAFRVAERLHQRAPDDAIRTALEGLRAHPQMPELLWVLGAAHLAKDEPAKALAWGMMALAIVQFDQGTPHVRSGFRWPPAFSYAPLEIMAVAFGRLGKLPEAEAATQAVARMKAALSSPATTTPE